MVSENCLMCGKPTCLVPDVKKCGSSIRVKEKDTEEYRFSFKTSTNFMAHSKRSINVSVNYWFLSSPWASREAVATKKYTVFGWF